MDFQTEERQLLLLWVTKASLRELFFLFLEQSDRIRLWFGISPAACLHSFGDFSFHFPMILNENLVLKKTIPPIEQTHSHKAQRNLIWLRLSMAKGVTHFTQSTMNYSDLVGGLERCWAFSQKHIAFRFFFMFPDQGWKVCDPTKCNKAYSSVRAAMCEEILATSSLSISRSSVTVS